MNIDDVVKVVGIYPIKKLHVSLRKIDFPNAVRLVIDDKNRVLHLIRLFEKQLTLTAKIALFTLS